MVLDLSKTVTFADLTKPDKTMTYEELLAWTEKHTFACVLLDSNGTIQYVIPVLGTNAPAIDIRLLRALGWSVDVIHTEKVDFTALSDSYWTCKCAKNFVRHKMALFCRNCKTGYDEENRLPYIEKILSEKLRWEFIVGENNG